MSSIKTTQIDGDVSVGRNVAIGGGVTIQGTSSFKGNVKVDGWLDAKNIKGANKGIFTTVEKLRETYALPHDGWWAIVGRTLPGPIYVADGGEWVATGETGGNPTIDSEQYNQNITELQSDIAAAKSDISDNAEEIKSLKIQTTTQGNNVNQLQVDVKTAQTAANNAQMGVSAVSKTISDFRATKGMLNGLAPLDENGKVSEEYLPDYVNDVIEFESSMTGITAQHSTSDKSSTDENCTIVYNQATNRFVLALTTVETEETPAATTYYANWKDADRYGTSSTEGRAPVSGKVYIDASDNITYRWDSTALTPIGSDLSLGYTEDTAFPGDKGAVLQTDMTDVKKRVTTLEGDATQLKSRGVVNVNKLLGTDADMTFSVVLSKMDDLSNKSDYQIPGIVLTFKSPTKGWQSKQWTNTESWGKESNWTDFGSNGSSIGNTINVNNVCPDVEYTLSTAIKAVQDLQAESDLSYFKSGVVLTFKTAEKDGNGAPVWAAYQFAREVPDINPADTKPWVVFGGGGEAKVEVSPDPQPSGETAFSTGGAYTHIPTNLKLDIETEGVVKLQLVNADNEGVGDEQQFSVGTGSGTGGTTIAIAFKENPLYNKAGGSFIVRAAIMSISKAGSQETSNSITSVAFIDRTTKKTVQTFTTNKPSSATLEDYSFDFDLSALYTTAGQGSLQMLVTDDGSNTASKNLSIISIDVTCVSTQTLNYTKDTALELGGKAKNILMYAFPNNSSDKGIKTTIEIFRNNAWQQIASPTINDTYSHTVNIDPTGLSHGAYPIRIQGQDVASGVKGNVLHTGIMVIQQDSSLEDYDKPIVVARWSDDSDGKKQLFSSVNFDVAVYQRSTARPEATVTLTNTTSGKVETITKQVMAREGTFHISKRLVGYDEGNQLRLDVTSGTTSLTEPYDIAISGTLLPISETEGAVFKISMAERSNADSDKTIATDTTDGQKVSIVVNDSNYSTNGFVKDSFGTKNYGTADDPGRMALRIAEDVTAKCSYHPFASNSIGTNGVALSFTVMTKNVADPSAHLIECMGEKLGFVLTGEKLVFATAGSLTDSATSATIPYVTDKVTRFDIVAEPSAIAPYSGIGVIKIFRNGDEAGAVTYKAGEFPNHDMPITFDGHKADVYLYEITAWNTYYNFIQACNNYLIGLTDTTAMLSEYEQNNVMASITAEGTTKDRPTMQKCIDAGLMTCVICKNSDTEDVVSSYPDYLEDKDGDKKTKQVVDWYCYFPDRPWQDCKIVGVSQTNQGTTSSWRPIKNKKGKFKQAVITLLHTREDIAAMYPGNTNVLAKYDKCASMAAKQCIQIIDGGNFTNISTIKVDYSDSCGAHNGAMMELMNDTQIALGEKYMVPAQIYNEGDYEIHTSIDSVPCALFRTDSRMNHSDAENPTKAYFHAKANFNADKGDAKFFGFEDVPGYTKGCLNYGDFIELVADKGQILSAYKSSVLSNTAQLIAGNIYVLSEYLGNSHYVLENDGKGAMREVDAVASPTEVDKTLAEVLADSVNNYKWQQVYITNDGHYVQYQGGNWIDTTGAMTFNKSTKKWSITGRVVNPTETYEYLKYDSFCWLQDVNSIEDMMRIDPATTFPIWMSYYESRYPDDDDLNALYQQGKKAPYNLYRWLHFAQQCNQHLTSDDGEITLGGKTVVGTAENRFAKWQQEVHKYANPYSINCYVVASDYKAAVDQRSKNMMVTFQLEPDGSIRAYFNAWYDGDCVDGSDNDAGLTIPWDMDATTSHLYQGWDSVMFVQTYIVSTLWVDDKGDTTTSLHDVADEMRKAERNNRKVFSADGCYYYWVTKRLGKWAKVTSSFDGERKYIQSSTAGSKYFYALHGLRLEDLPDYQRKRFKLRDGYYQVGDLYVEPFKARMMGDVRIGITAAQDGFFGLGEDRADTVADSIYLKAGESYTLTANTAQEIDKMIYIFGADKLSVLDISACTPKQDGVDFSTCKLLKELIVGGENYTPAYTTGILSSLELPAMPFLEKIDIRRTKVLNILATGCPRLKTVLANGSTLKTFKPAEASPLETAQFPASMTDIDFVNMPKVAYPNGMLTYEGLSKVTSVKISGCPAIDPVKMLGDIIAAGAAVAAVNITNINTVSDETILVALKTAGTIGINSSDKTVCDGLTGKWTMKHYLKDDVLAPLQKYFPNLNVKQQLYTDYVIYDNTPSSKNVFNTDNGTGYINDNTYVDYQASGHILNIRNRSKAVRGTFNAVTGKMRLELLSDTDYTKMADGVTDSDIKDSLGKMYDFFKLIPHHWFKGINDYKNQQKHILLSSWRAMPESTATVTRKPKLSRCMYKDIMGLATPDIIIGSTFTDAMLSTLTSCAVYRIDVSGMKQVRYIGLNNAGYCSMFTNANNVIIQKDILSISGINESPFDFKNEAGDYLFRDVPKDAAWLYFTCMRNLDDDTHMILTTDSSDIEAIEPGWEEYKANLIGIYGGVIDGLGMMRSISGVTTRTGDGTSVTSTEWKYDAEGNPTNPPVSIPHYTYQDMLNLCAYRGKNYHSISYEQNKTMAYLSLAWCGNRDEQLYYGNGCPSRYTTGQRDNIGNADTKGVNGTPNKIWGIEGFVACNWEIMDYIGANIPSFAEWKAKQRTDANIGGAIDAIYHIYDGKTKTERTVQGLSVSDVCTSRTKHGRYCDTIASSAITNSRYDTGYCCGYYITMAYGRCVGRASVNAGADGGLVYSYAGDASSNSSAIGGVRVSFSGEIENESEIDPTMR